MSPYTPPEHLPEGGGPACPMRVKKLAQRHSRARQTLPPPMPPAAQRVKMKRDLACLSARR